MFTPLFPLSVCVLITGKGCVDYGAMPPVGLLGSGRFRSTVDFVFNRLSLSLDFLHALIDVFFCQVAIYIADHDYWRLLVYNDDFLAMLP